MGRQGTVESHTVWGVFTLITGSACTRHHTLLVDQTLGACQSLHVGACQFVLTFICTSLFVSCICLKKVSPYSNYFILIFNHLYHLQNQYCSETVLNIVWNFLWWINPLEKTLTLMLPFWTFTFNSNKIHVCVWVCVFGVWVYACLFCTFPGPGKEKTSLTTYFLINVTCFIET